jgi:hypothetical protein
MQFPQQFPELTIPTGAGPADPRITINRNQNGAILVYGTGGVLVASIAGVAGIDEYGNSYQAGSTVYDVNTFINLLGNNGIWQASDGSQINIQSGGSVATVFLTPPTSGSNVWIPGQLDASQSAGRPQTDLFSPSEDSTAAFALLSLFGGTSVSSATRIEATADTIALQGLVTLDSVFVGRTTITPAAAGVPELKTVNFGPLPGTLYRGFTNVSVGAVTNIDSHITNITATSADIYLTRNSTTATLIDYMIWAL